MYPYNDDVAWQRMVDMQREMENSRLWAADSANRLRRAAKLAALLVERVWLLAGLAMQRPPRRQPLARLDREDTASASDAA